MYACSWLRKNTQQGDVQLHNQTLHWWALKQFPAYYSTHFGERYLHEAFQSQHHDECDAPLFSLPCVYM